MTELEETELTDGQGRALSDHRTQRAYQGYAKRSLKRALPGTRKRHAHCIATAAAEQAQADRAAESSFRRPRRWTRRERSFAMGTRTSFAMNLQERAKRL
jgi:hypothetical protein